MTRRAQVDLDKLRYLIEEEGLTQIETARRLHTTRKVVENRCKWMGLATARTGPRSMQDHPLWKGGRILAKFGYISWLVPLHPRATRHHDGSGQSGMGGQVLEHRLLMEVMLGRYLQPGEVIDHLDSHPRHNWPENLRLFACNADHLKATLTGRFASSRTKSIPGAYGCNQKMNHCPSENETLAQCPSKIRLKLAEHIEIHRPTKEHRTLSRRQILGSGPIRPAFQF